MRQSIRICMLRLDEQRLVLKGVQIVFLHGVQGKSLNIRIAKPPDVIWAFSWSLLAVKIRG